MEAASRQRDRVRFMGSLRGCRCNGLYESSASEYEFGYVQSYPTPEGLNNGHWSMAEAAARQHRPVPSPLATNQDKAAEKLDRSEERRVGKSVDLGGRRS